MSRLDEALRVAQRCSGLTLTGARVVEERERNRMIRASAGDVPVFIKAEKQPGKGLLGNEIVALDWLNGLGRFGVLYLGGDPDARVLVMAYLEGMQTL